jgi:hypothetical protein
MNCAILIEFAATPPGWFEESSAARPRDQARKQAHREPKKTRAHRAFAVAQAFQNHESSVSLCLG